MAFGLSRDQLYGALIFLIGLLITVLYLAVFASGLLPPLSFLGGYVWWAVAAPVVLFVLAVLVITMWIGWTMATTPPPAPLETVPPSPASEHTEEAEAKEP
jgi:hypothetical protein